MGNAADYDTDFYGWAMEQARLLRAGRWTEADIENIAEEIESMGRAEKRELVSRLTVLFLHLLKWRFQPSLRGPSWRATIRVQRRDLARLLDDNPSLKSALAGVIADAYGDAVIEAEAETGLAEQTFPAVCPWTFSEVADARFWPDGET